ncbi:4784_t:CDS:2 [Diversispora eburnea]|uniref:4784_t:CDS:1 n=1 Tax=Diversispora eburnea TaxID=1213867 RepID=A0A9N8ZFQ7_9GLOM|nr:4784_t:CDS:2 [Diversispora eburnea]
MLIAIISRGKDHKLLYSSSRRLNKLKNILFLVLLIPIINFMEVKKYSGLYIEDNTIKLQYLIILDR